MIYILFAGLLPFVKARKVGEDYIETASVDRFYSEITGVDRAAIIEDSSQALDIRMQMFEQAKERIVLSTFSIKTDRVSEEIFAALIAAADRGVKVQLIIDGLSGGYDMKAAPMDYVAGTHPNIEIRYYNIPNLLKPWTFNGQLHDKYILIDDTCLLLGGRNTSNYFLGNYNPDVLSYDREIFVYNTASGTPDSPQSVISDVYAYFDTVWNDKSSVTVFDHIPFHKKKQVEEAALHLDEVYLTMKQERPQIFLPVDYEDMYDILRTTADSVPRFEMMLNSVAVGDNFMGSSDYTFNKKKILATGVTVYEYQGDHSMHNKSLLIDDDISVIGSFNFDMRSAYIDTECMLVIHGTEFNALLEAEILRMQEDSLQVAEDGSYLPGDVAPAPLPASKKLLYRITSIIFQPFRFLM